MISHKYKFIFIFPPKTGSTSLSKYLLNYANFEHFLDQRKANSFDFSEFKNDFNENRWLQVPVPIRFSIRRKHATLFSYYDRHVSEYSIFTTIRNPYDRMVSFWKYWSTFVNNRFKNDFKSFVLSSKKFVLPQFDFINSDIVPFNKINIVRFENIQTDFDLACDKIKIPRTKLSHENKTEHKHYTEYFDNESREIIETRFAKDLDYFGYKF